MSETNEDLIRSFYALLDDAWELHKTELTLRGESTDGHTAVSEQGADIECLTCGHINEAEYELAYFTGTL